MKKKVFYNLGARALDKRDSQKNVFSYFLTKTYIVGTY